MTSYDAIIFYRLAMSCDNFMTEFRDLSDLDDDFSHQISRRRKALAIYLINQQFFCQLLRLVTNGTNLPQSLPASYNTFQMKNYWLNDKQNI